MVLTILNYKLSKFLMVIYDPIGTKNLVEDILETIDIIYFVINLVYYKV